MTNPLRPKRRGLIKALTILLVSATACSEPTTPPAEPKAVVQIPPPPAGPPNAPLPTGPWYPPENGSEYIYLVKADGTSIQPLIRGNNPAWSPDGRKIAFQLIDKIHIVNADGSNSALIGAGGSPSWSPDGTTIAFTSVQGISVMNADGTNPRMLISHAFRDNTYKPGDMGVGDPAWSPDGKQIAFIHFGDGDIAPAQIFVMEADGSNPHLLTASAGGTRYSESDPSWAPNSSSLLFWTYGYGIATVSSLGGIPTSIIADFPAVTFGATPRWSPNGRTIVFTKRNWSTGSTAVWEWSADWGFARELISNAHSAAWSPDGAMLATVGRLD